MELDRRHVISTTATVLTLLAGCLDSTGVSPANDMDGPDDDDTLSTLVARNDAHTDGLSRTYFDEVVDGQRPPFVSICCSDSRVTQEGMWDVREPGWLFTPSNIGNVVWDEYDGNRVVDGSVLYPVAYTETDTIVVVGHSRCGAVQAAYTAVTEGVLPAEPGIAKRVGLLSPAIEDGLTSGLIDPTGSEEDVIAGLVEYNVHEQVSFLLGDAAVPDDVDVFGFVYDFHATHGTVRGRTYLVNANGTTDVDTLRDVLGQEYDAHVASVLDAS